MAQPQNVVYVEVPATVVVPVAAPPPYSAPLPVRLPFGTNPLRMTCPHCHSEIVTKIECVANKITHFIALGLCLFGFCCCAPCVYCVDEFQAKKHICPKCQQMVGIYDKVLGLNI